MDNPDVGGKGGKLYVRNLIEVERVGGAIDDGQS